MNRIIAHTAQALYLIIILHIIDIKYVADTTNEEYIVTLLENAKKCALFASMDMDETEKILRCTGAAICKFEKGEMILKSGQPIPRVGILLKGTALIARDDAEGNRLVLSRAMENEMLGLIPLCPEASSEGVYTLAQTDAEVLMLDGRKLIDGCEARCFSHSVLLKNIISIMAKKNYGLIKKQCHMGKRSLRGKLSSYLSEQAELGGSSTFEIPLNRQALSDYLGADRSALSAELSRMKRDGLIDYHREKFRILQPLPE